MISPVTTPAASLLNELDRLKRNELLGPVMVPVTVELETEKAAPWTLMPKYFQAKK